MVGEFITRAGEVAVREAAHLGGGVLIAFAGHFIAPQLLVVIVASVWVAAKEVRDYVQRRDSGWKAVLDVTAWYAGLALGTLAGLSIK